MRQRFTISWSVYADVKANRKALRKSKYVRYCSCPASLAENKITFVDSAEHVSNSNFPKRVFNFSRELILAMTETKFMKTFILVTYCK